MLTDLSHRLRDEFLQQLRQEADEPYRLFPQNSCLRKRRCSASVFRACANWPNHGLRTEKPENIWRFPVQVCFIMKSLCFTHS